MAEGANDHRLLSVGGRGVTTATELIYPLSELHRQLSPDRARWLQCAITGMHEVSIECHSIGGETFASVEALERYLEAVSGGALCQSG